MSINEAAFEDLLEGDPVSEAPSSTSAPSFSDLSEDVPAETSPEITIKFLADGFTALGRTWMTGETLSVIPGTEKYDNTKDGEGNSWLDLAKSDEAQSARYGKVFFELVA